MAVDVEHGRLVLVGARGDQEMWDRYAMLTACRELTLSSQRGCDRLGVDAKLMERVELGLELVVGTSGAGAVEHLEFRDRAQARLPVRVVDVRAAHERSLVQQQPAPLARPSQLHAASASNRSTSTSDGIRSSAGATRTRRSRATLATSALASA